MPGGKAHEENRVFGMVKAFRPNFPDHRDETALYPRAQRTLLTSTSTGRFSFGSTELFGDHGYCCAPPIPRQTIAPWVSCLDVDSM